MLVLSRKKNEKIVILDAVTNKVIATIQITEIKGDKVRVGVVADKTTPVHREEVYRAIIENEEQK